MPSKRVNLICQTCGSTFSKPPSRAGKYCCKECYWESLKKEKVRCVCSVCGKVFTRHASRVHSYAFCSEHRTEASKRRFKKLMQDADFVAKFKTDRYGENNPAWKENRQEYRLIKCPKKFSSMSDSNGQVKFHRLIVAQALDRPLTTEEVVHHVDEDIQNNTLSNLELFSSKSEHTAYHMGNKNAKPIWRGDEQSRLSS